MSYLIKLSTPPEADTKKRPEPIGSITLRVPEQISQKTLADIERKLQRILHPGLPIRVKNDSHADQIWLHLIVAIKSEKQLSILDESTMPNDVIRAALTQNNSSSAHQHFITQITDQNITVFVGDEPIKYDEIHTKKGLNIDQDELDGRQKPLNLQTEKPDKQNHEIDKGINPVNNNGDNSLTAQPSSVPKNGGSNDQGNTKTSKKSDGSNRGSPEDNQLPPVIQIEYLEWITKLGGLRVNFRDGTRQYKYTVEALEIAEKMVNIVAQEIFKKPISTKTGKLINATEIDQQIKHRIFEWLCKQSSHNLNDE